MRAPRWLGLLAALVALGAGSGCPGETPPCFSRPPAQATNTRLFGAGEEVSLQVSAGVGTSCTDEGTLQQGPDSVTVEVYGPENQSIPATAVLQQGTASAIIRFTPPETGRYHILVAFAPVGSLQQLGIFVAADRHGEAPLARLPSLSNCRYLDRTRQGTWLCGARALREEDGAPQLLGVSSDAPMVVAGDVVWTVDGSVRRFVDTGSGPLQPTDAVPFLGSGPGGPVQAVVALLATEDELLVHNEQFLYRYTFTEGRIRSAPAASVLPMTAFPFGSDGVTALLVRAGPRVLVVSRSQDTTAFTVQTRVCAFEARTATGSYTRALEEPCQQLEGEPGGFEDGVLWTRTATFATNTTEQTLRRYVVVNGRLAEEGALVLDGQLTVDSPFLRPGATVPVVYGMGTVGPYALPRWNPEQHQLGLELSPTLSGAFAWHRGQRFLWLDAPGAGGVAVFPRVRPSSP